MPATLKNVFQMIVDRYIIGDLRSNRLCFAWVRDKRGFLWEVKVERPRVELPASAAPVSAAPVSAVSSAASISGRRIGESYYHVSVVRCYRKHAAGVEDINPGTAETMTVHPWAGPSEKVSGRRYNSSSNSAAHTQASRGARMRRMRGRAGQGRRGMRRTSERQPSYRHVESVQVHVD